MEQLEIISFLLTWPFLTQNPPIHLSCITLGSSCPPLCSAARAATRSTVLPPTPALNCTILYYCTKPLLPDTAQSMYLLPLSPPAQHHLHRASHPGYGSSVSETVMWRWQRRPSTAVSCTSTTGWQKLYCIYPVVGLILGHDRLDRLVAICRIYLSISV